MDVFGVVTGAIGLCQIVVNALAQVKANIEQRDHLHSRLADVAQLLSVWLERLQRSPCEPLQAQSICERVSRFQAWLTGVKNKVEELQQGGIKDRVKKIWHKDSIKSKLERWTADLVDQIALLTLVNTFHTVAGISAERSRSIIADWNDKARSLQEELDEWIRKFPEPEDAYENFRMSPKGTGSATDEQNRTRKTLKGFWDAVAEEVRDRSLTVADKDWLQHAHSYRLLVEPLDIANYYRLKLWAQDNGSHYLQDNNRPVGYQILQTKWEEYYKKAAGSSTATAAREQQAVEVAHSSLEELRDLAQAGTAANRDDLENAASDAGEWIEKCRLPTTLSLFQDVMNRHKLAAPAGQLNQQQLALDANAVLKQLKKQKCENSLQ